MKSLKLFGRLRWPFHCWMQWNNFHDIPSFSKSCAPTKKDTPLSDELIFPANFYIINMNDEFASNITYILLGRLFMKTMWNKIDVNKGTLSFKFDGEIVTFNIFDAMTYHEDSESFFHIDMIDLIRQEMF